MYNTIIINTLNVIKMTLTVIVTLLSLRVPQQLCMYMLIFIVRV